MTCKREISEVPASQAVCKKVRTSIIEELVNFQEDRHSSIADSGTNTSLTGPSGSTTTPDWVDVEEINPRKNKPKTAAEVVTEPIAPYFKALTNKSKTEEHPMMSYFKGIMMEIKNLSATSQRCFEMDVVEKLNHYYGIEDGLVVPSTPLSGPSSIDCFRQHYFMLLLQPRTYL